MKFTTVSVRQLERKGKPWQARATYYDVYGKRKEVSKMLPEAKGKREAQKIAKEWLDALNAEADLMPNVGKQKTVDKIYTEYLKHQLDTGEIEKSTYSNSLYSYNKYIKPYLGDYIFATVDKTVINSWLTKLYQAGLSQNTIHTTYARLKKVYNYFYNNGELLKDPFKGVKMPKKGEAKTTHLTNEQMDNVLTAVTKVIIDQFYTDKKHFHKCSDELYYVIKGNCALEVNNTHYLLEEGKCILIEHGEQHFVRGLDNIAELIVVCSPAWDETDCFYV